MNPLLNMLIGPVFDVIGKVIDRAWPDPTEAAKIKAQVFQAQQEFATKELDASLQLALQQMKVTQKPIVFCAIGVSRGIETWKRRKLRTFDLQERFFE